VTARFTLDAMPGKQMAIDADLNAGLITEQQARRRRENVAREAEFCGAMDGAARFSQRDSLATILIMAINIIAGFLIGVFQQGIPFQEALKTYTILTVGDGLVSIRFGCRRHRCHARRVEGIAWHQCKKPDPKQSATALDRWRRIGRAGTDSGSPENGVLQRSRPPDVCGVQDEDRESSGGCRSH